MHKQLGKIAVIDLRSRGEIKTRMVLALYDDGVICKRITHINGDPVKPAPSYERWKFCKDEAVMAKAQISRYIARTVLEIFAEQNYYQPTGEYE